MPNTMQDVGVKVVKLARWLFGGIRRLGNATSLVRVFFVRKLAFRSHLKLRGRWQPIEDYDFDGAWRRVERSDC